MRFSTLLSKHGPIKHALECSEEEWQKAVAEKRFCTVYHGDNDHGTPLEGLVAHHGFVNTICKITFTKPLPLNVTHIIGMRDNREALDLCNR